MATDKTPSEYGGEAGMVAPLPHDFTLTAYEEARLQRATEPTDPNDTAAAALVRERAREGRTASF